MRLYGPVCPLHQLGLRGGEAEHGPETPQSEETYVHQVWHAQVPREGRGGHSDFVTAESCWLFDCSKNDPEFLSLSVEEWKTDDQFMEAEKFIKTLKCNNPGVDKGTLNKGCDRL